MKNAPDLRWTNSFIDASKILVIVPIPAVWRFTVAKYKSKSVEVEALQYSPDKFEEMEEFLGESGEFRGDTLFLSQRNQEDTSVGEGHWLVKDESGNVTVLSDAEFQNRYEESAAPDAGDDAPSADEPAS